MAEKFKAALKKRGPSGVGMFGSGQWTIWEGYAAAKLFKAGFRSNNLDPNARHCMASAVGRLHAHLRHRRADGLLRRHRGRRRVRAVGLEHGRDAPDPVDAGDRSPALRAACAGRRALDLRAPLVRSRRHRHGVQAADRPLSSSTPSPTTSSRPAASTRTSSPSIRCSSAARPTSATACARSIRCSRRRPARAKANDATDMTLRRVREVRVRLHAGEGGRDVRRAAEPARGAGRALRRSQDQGHQLLDHGLQPAHPRRLVQQPRLQHPSADRENLRARQQPVLADRPAVGLRHRARGRHVLASPARRHGGDQQGASRHRREDLEAARGHHSRQARLSRRAAEPDAEGRQAQRLLGAGEQQPAGRPPTSTRKAIPAIATRTTSSSCRTPIRP